MITTQPERSRGGKRWKWGALRRVVLVILLLVVAFIGGVIFLLRSQPPQWKAHQRFLATHTNEQIEQLAASAEENITKAVVGSVEVASESDLKETIPPQAEQSTDGKKQQTPPQPEVDPTTIRIDEVRQLTLTRDEMSALVATRYETWMKSRGYVKPEQISDPMIQLENGKVVMAFKFNSRGFSQVFTGWFNIHFDDDGYVTLTLDSLEAGRMPIPSGELGSYLQQWAGESTQAAGEWLSKLQKFRFKPVMDDLPYRRRARLLSYQVNGDKVELSLRVQDHQTYAESNRTLNGKLLTQTQMVEVPID